MNANEIKNGLDQDKKHLRTPNILEFFIFMVLILLALYLIGIINYGTGPEQQLIFLILAAGSSVVIGTAVKTYLERDVLFF
jgi:hypothetical protein